MARKFSQRHYEAIANEIRIARIEATPLSGGTPEDNVEEGVAWVASRLSSLFASDNPKFDRIRFLEACG